MSRFMLLVMMLTALLTGNQAAYAGNMCQVTPSTQKLVFEAGSPDAPITKQRITLQTCISQNDGKGHEVKYDDRYLEASSLRGPKGTIIKAENLLITTEYGVKDRPMDRPVKVLAAKDTTAWFEIGLDTDATDVVPGTYKGTLQISGEKWQIDVELNVSSFVHLTIAPGRLNFDVSHPGIFEPDAPGKLNFNVKANYQGWRVTMDVEPGAGLVNTQNAEWVLPADRFYFRLEPEGHGSGCGCNGRKGKPGDAIIPDGYTRLKPEQNLITDSFTYPGPSTKMHFLLDAETEWQKIRAGEYTGTFVFTVEG